MILSRRAEYRLLIRAACQALGMGMPLEERLTLEDIMPGHRDRHPAAPRHWFAPCTGRRRRWRCDYTWPEHRIAVEIEGIVYGGGKGRHQTETGYTADATKYNALSILGYTLLRYTPEQLRAGHLLADLEALSKLGRLRAEKD